MSPRHRLLGEMRRERDENVALRAELRESQAREAALKRRLRLARRALMSDSVAHVRCAEALWLLDLRRPLRAGKGRK